MEWIWLCARTFSKFGNEKTFCIFLESINLAEGLKILCKILAVFVHFEFQNDLDD